MGNSADRILIVAATSRPWELDDATVRYEYRPGNISLLKNSIERWPIYWTQLIRTKMDMVDGSLNTKPR